MSSAANHRKRSHRSHVMHYRAAARRMRAGSAPEYQGAGILRQLTRRMFQREPRRPIRTVEGEIWE